MSHFTVTVALPGTLAENEIEEALSQALAPFDENLEVPRYVKYTREQLIEKGRAKITQFRDGAYAEFHADPIGYTRTCSNIAHLEYIVGGSDAMARFHIKEVRDRYTAMLYQAAEAFKNDPMFFQREHTGMSAEESFPPKLTWTDEQVYAHEVSWYEPEELGPEGEVYSTYNPKSQWDWYSVGGRWTKFWHVLDQADEAPSVESYDAGRAFAEMIERVRPGDATEHPDVKLIRERDARPGKRVDVARKCDIDFATSGHGDDAAVTFAFLTSDGEWHERGSMGWWGVVSDEQPKDTWEADWTKLMEAESDNAWFVLVDCHI